VKITGENMKVTFNFYEEFIDEMKKDYPFIDRGVVRITRQWKQDKNLHPLRHLNLLAFYSIKNDPGSKTDQTRCIVSLNQFLGSFMRDFPEQETVLAKADEIQDLLEKAVEEVKLEVRAGSLSEGEE